MEGVLMAEVNRRYYVRRAIVGAQIVFLVVLLLSWTLLIAERAAGPFVAIAAIATVVALWQGVQTVRNAGVRETPDGIINRRALGYRQWRWEDIEKFTSVRSRVYLVTHENETVELAGINEGWRNTWNGGETRQITALLNQRLAACRGDGTPGPSQVTGTIQTP